MNYDDLNQRIEALERHLETGTEFVRWVAERLPAVLVDHYGVPKREIFLYREPGRFGDDPVSDAGELGRTNEAGLWGFGIALAKKASGFLAEVGTLVHWRFRVHEGLAEAYDDDGPANLGTPVDERDPEFITRLARATLVLWGNQLADMADGASSGGTSICRVSPERFRAAH